MTALAKTRYIMPGDYLAQEREAETKSEYCDGILVAMAGASWEHNLITGNLQGEIHAQLRGTSCVSMTQDMRVRVPACNRYYYPDVVVACREPEFEEISSVRSLQNPTLIIEVLSDSTEARDRGEKLICYETLDSLTTYVLVAHDRPLVEVFRRQENGWLHTVARGLETSLSLDAIGCAVRLSDIYANVTFPQPREPEVEEGNPTD